MKKFQYIISLNGRVKAKEPLVYSFGLTKGIEIHLGRGKVTFCFGLSVKKDVGDFLSFKVKAFHDMYRKAYLIHALQYRKGLNVKEISLCIDGVETIVNMENDQTGHFPYMFSMISTESFTLPDLWVGIIPCLVQSKRSETNNKTSFTALYSYLASKNKRYEIDRFSCLWTAMNAYYTSQVMEYQRWLVQNESYCQPEKWDKLSVATETDMIGALAWQLERHYKRLDKADAEKIWNNKNFILEKLLGAMDENDIKLLYQLLIAGSELPEKFRPVFERAAEFGALPLSFMLLLYPYHYRCKYLHGDTVTTLISAYNDYEIAGLHAMNYFLDSFLSEKIPEMFTESYWNDEKQEIMKEYLHFIKMDKNNRDRYQEALDKAAKEIEV